MAGSTSQQRQSQCFLRACWCHVILTIDSFGCNLPAVIVYSKWKVWHWDWSLNILVFWCLLLFFLLWGDLEPQKPTLPTHQLLLLHPLRCSFYREKYQINKRESWRRKGALNTYVIHLLQKERLGWAKTQSKRDPRLILKAEIKYDWSWGWETPFWDLKSESWAGDRSPRAS